MKRLLLQVLEQERLWLGSDLLARGQGQDEVAPIRPLQVGEVVMVVVEAMQLVGLRQVLVEFAS